METTACLNFGSLNSETFAESFCQVPGIQSYLLNYKLPETIVYSPNFCYQTIAPSSKNRYFTSVKIAPICPSKISVSLAAGATFTISNSYVDAGTSSNTSYATVDVKDNVATITAVAEGTSTITLTHGTLTSATIEVTVTAAA